MAELTTSSSSPAANKATKRSACISIVCSDMAEVEFEQDEKRDERVLTFTAKSISIRTREEEGYGKRLSGYMLGKKFCASFDDTRTCGLTLTTDKVHGFFNCDEQMHKQFVEFANDKKAEGTVTGNVYVDFNY
ncbi:uncharacterized protein I206_105842 [Kwoniella pini CBS 10737]|uniref:Uncharacterized protein n=1 Tax=Kwoniella pini CBS 10737 TaxID=1296096 RepID=A0A1B9I0C8_9TREE|nr:uncharacterized protein I206_04662 [Kwoniella pini CBS 10737]OCF48975.1 hypothetical protein I206_04662 [Kwoniella pini CBS 10737]